MTSTSKNLQNNASNDLTIYIKYKVNSNTETKKINEVFTELKKGIENKKPLSCYEFYDTNNTNYIKPFIDIDIKKNIKEDDTETINDTINTLKHLFGNDINILYSTDHRTSKKKGKKYYEPKHSFHFVITNKKINPVLLGKYLNINKNQFKHKIDTSVYRNGENKFRLPLTIKEIELEHRRTKNSFMKIEGGDTLENFTLFSLTNTEGLEEVNITLPTEKKNDKKIIKRDFTNENILDNIEFVKLNLKPLKPVLDNYNLGTPKYDAEKLLVHFNLLDGNCPFGETHDSNNPFFTLDVLDNTLYHKCHSKKCENKQKIIIDNVYRRLSEFNLQIFLRLEDYKLQKKYLEKRVIFLSDIAKYKQIKYDKSNNFIIEDISFNPIASVNYKYLDDEGKEKTAKFGDTYIKDKYRKVYKNTIFYPKLNDDEAEYYDEYFNEFQGLGFERILPYYEDKEKIYKEQEDNIKFYLEFLKKNVCDDRDDILHFFISSLSFFIKYPNKLNHLILVFYSNEQGTGKSSLIDFLFRILGIIYCANSEIEQVLDKHSNLSYKKILNVIEELCYDKGHNYSKKLKNKSQADTTTLNEKCESMRTIDNFTHYIITTNEYKSIILEPNDRRHFIVEFKKLYDDDLDIINKIEELYEDKYFIYAFGRFLLEYKEDWNFLSPKNWEKNRPTTELFRLMIKRDSIEKFFYSLSNYKLHNDNTINNAENYEYYIKEHLEHFILGDNGELLIKNSNLYDLYYNTNDNDKKFSKDSFISQLLDIKKFCKKKNYNDDTYLYLDLFKIRKHLKLNENDVNVNKIIKIMNDDNKPEKIKIKEIDNLLKNN